MNKQLTFKDYLWSLVFFLLLICIIASFFLGVKVGKDTTERRYEHLVGAQSELPDDSTSYAQQHLVSFYHNIYLPYREFSNKWFEDLDKIELRKHTVDPAAVLRELEKLAQRQYEEMQDVHFPETSPKLKSAHENYMKSLHLFAKAMGKSSLKRLNGSELIAALEQDEFVAEARSYALQAQEDYFQSIVEWHRLADGNVKVPESLDQVTLAEWNEMPLTVKNWLVTVAMKQLDAFANVYPQDVSLNIDILIENGQAARMNLETVQEIVDMLIHTRAVRLNDFIALKDRYYAHETLPQLPFFTE